MPFKLGVPARDQAADRKRRSHLSALRAELVFNMQTAKNTIAKAPRHYQYLDALRGIAFLGVLLCHAAQNTALFTGIAVAMAGRFGVQLFFLISAVTIMLSWSKRNTIEYRPARNFYIRRLFRIVPMFWIGALFYVYWSQHGVTWKQILSTLLFVHIWTPGTVNAAVVPGGWSIGVEMTFYILVPAIARVVRGIRAAVCVTGAALLFMAIANRLGASCLYQGLPSDEHSSIDNFLFFWFPSQLPVFLIGITLFWMLQKKEWMNQLRFGYRCALTVGAAVGMMILFSYRMPSFFSPQVIYALLFSPLIAALSVRPYIIFVNPFTCGLGVISYSCYLTHFFVLSISAHLLKSVAFSANVKTDGTLRFLCLSTLSLLGTIVLSYMMYRWVERPGIDIGRGIIRRLEEADSKDGMASRAESVKTGVH